MNSSVKPAKSADRFSKGLCWALACLPIAYLILLLYRYGLNVPYLDQWELPPLLEKSYQGTLGFRDFWEQHNEHRLIFPKLIMVSLARLTQWHIPYEYGVSVTLAIGIFLCCAYQLSLTARRMQLPAVYWLIPVLSLIIFSLGQWQNWFWGWQLQEFLNVLAVVGCVILLSHPNMSWIRFCSAILCGVVASYSFANGMSVWPIGCVLIVLTSRTSQRLAGKRLAWWTLCGAIIFATYLYDYHAPEHHPSVWYAFNHPLLFSVYVFKYIGAPLINFHPVGSMVAGIAGLAAFLFLGYRLIYRNKVPITELLPYLGFSFYALATAIITGIGRVGFGTDQALSSRYVTMASLLWVTNVVFFYWSIVRPVNQEKRPVPIKKFMTAVVSAIMLVLLLMSSLVGTFQGIKLCKIQRLGQLALMSGQREDLLQCLYPRPETVKERREILARYHLGPFHENPQQLMAHDKKYDL